MVGLVNPPRFKSIHGIKVFSALLGGFTFQTLGFLAVTFCRVAVTPKQGGLLFREVGFFRCVALAAVKQPVLARVVRPAAGYQPPYSKLVP